MVKGPFMPPPITEIPPPGTPGFVFSEWMSSMGLRVFTPPFRSDRIEKALDDPLLFFLTNRLGLTPALSYSKALTRGTWFHTIAALWCNQPPEDTCPPTSNFSFQTLGLYASRLEARLQELRTQCAAMGIHGDRLTEVLAREEKDHHCARAWFDVALQVPFHTPKKTLTTLKDLILHKDHKIVGCEIRVSFNVDRCPGTPLIATFDLLIYNKRTNTLWVVDWKTCECLVTKRLNICPAETQSQLYLYAAREAIKSPNFLTSMNLPANVRLGGMIHVVVQKPTIEFGSLDRDFTVDVSPFTRGPRKGQPRNEKKYHGEPRFPNYLVRCRNWYLAEEDYLHLKDTRKAPPVGISWIFPQSLDGEALDRYHDRLEYTHDLCTRSVDPDPRRRFLANPSTLHTPGDHDNPYLPFYTCGLLEWPEIIRKGGFIQAPREAIDLEAIAL